MSINGPLNCATTPLISTVTSTCSVVVSSPSGVRRIAALPVPPAAGVRVSKCSVQPRGASMSRRWT
jgi:hypothetical protein